MIRRDRISFRFSAIACLLLVPAQGVLSTCSICWLYGQVSSETAEEVCHCCEFAPAETDDGQHESRSEHDPNPSHPDRCVCNRLIALHRTVDVDVSSQLACDAMSMLVEDARVTPAVTASNLLAVAESPPQSAPLIALTSRLLL